MLFWHCTMKTSKKRKTGCTSLKLNFMFLHVIKEPIEQFSSSSHLRNDQLNFSPYSVKIAKTCWRGPGKSFCLKSFHHLHPYTDHKQLCILLIHCIVKLNKTHTYENIPDCSFLLCKSTMRDKSVDTIPENGPFLHSGYTYPLPPKINVEFWTLKSFFLLQTTLIWGVRGFTAFKKNEI